MRVAVVNLTRGSFSGGYRRYLHELIPLLAGDPRISQLDVHVPPYAELGDVAGVVRSWPAGDARRAYKSLKTDIRARSDVVLIPTGVWIDSGLPTACMVRNMEPLVRPFRGNSLRDGAKNLARRLMVRWVVRKATRVIAVSDFVRDFLVRRWHLSQDRIVTIPHGVRPPTDVSLPSFAADVSGGPFIFTAGSIRPARGLEDLLIGATRSAAGRVTTVVAAGRGAGDAPAYRRRMSELARKSGLRVIWAGQLNAAEMAWSFLNATAFVMTSRVEACPNTVLEAMAARAVSVSTDSPPMPEFYGDAALYYRSGDSASLAEALDRIFAMSESGRAAMSDRAAQRARAYSWDVTARRTADLLADMFDKSQADPPLNLA